MNIYPHKRVENVNVQVTKMHKAFPLDTQGGLVSMILTLIFTYTRFLVLSMIESEYCYKNNDPVPTHSDFFLN